MSDKAPYDPFCIACWRGTARNAALNESPVPAMISEQAALAMVAAALERAAHLASIHSDNAADEIRHYMDEQQADASTALELIKTEVAMDAAARGEAAMLDRIEREKAKAVKEARLNPIVWDQDGRKLRFDDGMHFGKGYDWDAYDITRIEGYADGRGYIVWRESMNGDWCLYGTADGLYVQGLKDVLAAKARANEDWAASPLKGAATVAEPPQSMRLDTSPGEKVIFTSDGGYPAEREKAARYLIVGATYTVHRMEVGAFSSRVYLHGIKHGFNTTMFANLTPKGGEA